MSETTGWVARFVDALDSGMQEHWPAAPISEDDKAIIVGIVQRSGFTVVPTYGGDSDLATAMCSACSYPHMRGGTHDAERWGPCEAHEEVAAWLSGGYLVAQRDGAREMVARALASLGPGEDWPTNGSLGGGLTGTRDDEFRDGMYEVADAVLAALATPDPSPAAPDRTGEGQ